MLKIILKKAFALLVLISFLANQSILYLPLVYSQEATESAQLVSPTPVLTETQTPSPQVSPSGIPTPTELVVSEAPTPIPSVPSIISTPSATPQPSLSASPTISPTPSQVRFAPFKDSNKEKAKAKEAWVKGEIVVKFNESKVDLENIDGRVKALEFARSKGLEVVEHLKGSNISVFRIKSDAKVPAKIEELAKDSQVVFAERNFTYELSVINTNDPRVGDLWGLDNIGQAINNQNGTVDADIDLPEAWGVTEGKPTVIVAVVDTGIAYTHPDLTSSLWDGTNCKDENGDALGGCLYGYDFHDYDNDPFPDYAYWGDVASHGTHIAGTIAATKDNGKGIVGIAPNVKIMSLKSDLSISSLVSAIDFARVNGAKVINASWGGGGYSDALREAIERFTANGGLFIAAAGNNGRDLDTTGFYPATYPIDGIINVAATDNQDNLAGFSNYGLKTVDVGAPGVSILSSVGDYSFGPTYSESFDSLSPPTLPSGWTVSGNWRTVASQDPYWGNVLYPDAIPYSDNADMTITSSKVDLSGALSAYASFFARCDTEYTMDMKDYMEFQISKDGQTFETIYKFNEAWVDSDDDESNNITPPLGFFFADIPQEYINSDFQFRFHWVTNGENNNYEGCAIDEAYVYKTVLGNEEKYEFWNGTSMATPHVVAAAALLLSANPNLTNSQVKSIILSTGDSIPALSGKTITGKRINAAKALAAVKGPGILGIADDPSPVTTKTWNWYSEDESTKFRFSLDQNQTASLSGAFKDIKTASVSAGNGTYYLHVQAKAHGIESQVMTVYAVLDTIAPDQPQIPVSPPFPPISNENFVNFGWTLVEDVSGIAHYLYEAVNETTGEIWDSGATFVNNVWLYLTEGIWNIFVTAEDNAGNKGNVLAQQITIDQTGPAGTVTAPEADSFHNRLPDITVDFGEEESEVEYVNFWIEAPLASGVTGGGGTCGGGEGDGCNGGTGGGVSGIISTDSVAPYEAHEDDWASFEPFLDNPAPDGDYSVWVEAFDSLGNKASTNRVRFTYDTAAPQAPVVTDPATAIRVNSDTYTVTGTKDPGSFARIYKNGLLIAAEDAPQLGVQKVAGGGGSNIFSFKVALTQNATNDFQVSTIDFVGNESEKYNVPTITHDGVSPVISIYLHGNPIISPKVTPNVRDETAVHLEFSESVLVEVDILDAQGNKVRDIIQVADIDRLDTTWNGKDNNGNFVANGVYTINVIIIDNAGNKVSDLSKRVTVDNDVLSISQIDNKTVDEETILTFTAQASDEEGNPISYSLKNAPSGAQINTKSGAFIWLPIESQGPGTYTFLVEASNGYETVLEELSVTVREVNKAPAAISGIFSTDEDTTKIIKLVGDDADVPSNTLSYSIVANPSHGSVTLNGDTATYTPSANYFGSDSFTYKVNDGQENSNTATITMTVNSVNDVPVAGSQNVAADEDTIKAIILAATDIEQDALTYVIVQNPTNGTLSRVSDTQFIYIGSKDYFGSDSFTFKAIDSNFAESNIATITIAVNSVNDAPVAGGDNKTTLENNAVTILVSELLSNDTDIDGDTLVVTEVKNAQHGTVSLSGSSITFTPANGFVGMGKFDYTLRDGTTTSTGTVTIGVNPSIEVDEVLLTPIVTVNPETPTIVIGAVDFDSTITIPANVTNATIDVTDILTETGENKNKVALMPNTVTINSTTSVGTISLSLPAGITITGANNWTGIINAPTVLPNSSVTLTAVSGSTIVTSSVIEVGFGDVPLTFNKSVRMVIAGQAGKLAGYSRSSTFTQIATLCTADTQASADALLPSAGDCRIDVGSDLIIWTKHFTKFVTYTQTSTPASSGSSGGSGSSNSGSGQSASAQVCGNTKPASAPVLISAISTSPNEVTLTWSKAKDPVTYYLIAYGLGSGKMQYGNPNVGGRDTVSYVISGLSGDTTYYFKVRAGNGCMPGDFSNELSATPTGFILDTEPAGFEEGVLGDSTRPTQKVEEPKKEVRGVLAPLQKVVGPDSSQTARNIGGFILAELVFFLGLYIVYRLHFKNRQTDY